MEAHHVELRQRPDAVRLAREALEASLDRIELRDREGRQWRDAVAVASAALTAALASLVQASIERPSLNDDDPLIDAEISYFIEFEQ